MATHSLVNPCRFASTLLLLVLACAARAQAEDVNINAFSPEQGVKIHTYTSRALSGYNSIATLDFNGDGRADCAVSNYRSQENGLSVIMGSAAPPFEFDVASLATDNTRGFRMTFGHNQQWVGHAVASAGDFNGDGFDDLLIGDSGNAYLVYGREGGWENFDVNDLQTSSPRGFSINGFSGSMVQGIGDINGDGFDDIAIASDPHSVSNGAMLVLFGRAANPGAIDQGTFVPSDLNGFLVTHSTEPKNGFAVADKTDFNGDGLDDLAFIAHSSSVDALKTVPYVIFGKTSGHRNIDLSEFPNEVEKGVTFQTTVPNPTISRVGDFNGDGYDDILIGQPMYYPGPPTSPRPPGQVTILPGQAAPPSTMAMSEGWNFTGSDDYAIGLRPAPAGDLNGDGFADVAFFSMAHYITDPTRIFVFYGNATPAAETAIAELDTHPQIGITISAAPRTDKPSIAGAGDFQGDGRDDLFVNWFDAAGNAVAHIIYGKTPPNTSVTNWTLY